MFFLNATCGACEYCMSGWEALCPKQKNSGYTVPGFMREYAITSAAFILDELSDEQAARIIIVLYYYTMRKMHTSERSY